MKQEVLRLKVDGSFCAKFLDELGFTRYSDQLNSAYIQALENTYGQEYIEEPGVCFVTENVFDDGVFHAFVPLALQGDKAVCEAWKSLVVRSEVSIQNSGSYSRSIKSEWQFELDIRTSTSRCPAWIFMTIRDKEVEEVSIYSKDAVSLEHQWTAFLLRYL
jgi:hypothetical protein